MSVATAADPTPVVIGMMGSAPACANCFMGCASKTGADKAACGSACGPAASSAPPPAPPPVTAPLTAPADAPSGSGADSSAPRDTAPVPAPAPPSASECSDSSDDVVNAASGGLLPNCAAGKALCAVDPRIPAGCPLTCGVCKPECKDSPDEVVNAASGTHLRAVLGHVRSWFAVSTLSAAGGLLPNCAAGKALCAVDPRIPAGCPLSCGVCKPECKDSPDEVVNAVSGTHPSASFRFRD